MTKRKEINQELIDAFYSNDTLLSIAMKTHGGKAQIKKVWIEHFGEEETIKRNKIVKKNK